MTQGKMPPSLEDLTKEKEPFGVTEENKDGFPEETPVEEKGESSLLLIQSELVAKKSHYNKFGEFSYRSCEDILEGLKPLLLKYHSMLHLTDDIKEIGGHIYVMATAHFEDQFGVKFNSKAFARETIQKPKMGTEQLTGSASSYARKYALNGLFLIDDAKDPDSDDNSKQQPTSEQKQQEPEAMSIKDVNQFLEVWTGKIYGKHVFWKNKRFLPTPEQL